MPFVAERDGELVTPEGVDDDAKLYCRECGGEMRVKTGHERDGTFVARHFYHKHGAGGCSGGESETHERLKLIVLSKVKSVFDCAEVGVEKRIGQNIADVYAVLEERDEKYGAGIVCEVQYRHEGKDVDAVTKNYVREGYSVCWIEGADIEGRDVNLAEPDWHYAGEANEVKSHDTPSHLDEDIPKRDMLVCTRCVPHPELNKKPTLNYAYGGQDVYQCPRCMRYYIEKHGGRGGREVERVREANISQWR